MAGSALVAAVSVLMVAVPSDVSETMPQDRESRGREAPVMFLVRVSGSNGAGNGADVAVGGVCG